MLALGGNRRSRRPCSALSIAIDACIQKQLNRLYISLFRRLNKIVRGELCVQFLQLLDRLLSGLATPEQECRNKNADPDSLTHAKTICVPSVPIKRRTRKMCAGREFGSSITKLRRPRQVNFSPVIRSSTWNGSATSISKFSTGT